MMLVLLQQQKYSRKSGSSPVGLFDQEYKGEDGKDAAGEDVVQPSDTDLGLEDLEIGLESWLDCGFKKIKKHAIFVARRVEKCLNCLAHPWDLEGKKEDQGDQVEPEGEPRTWKTNKIIFVNSTQSSSKITNVLFWDRSAKSDTELSGNGSASGGEADAENKEGGEEQLEGLVLPNQRDRVLRQQGAEHQDQSCRDVEQAEGLLLLVSEPVQHGDDLGGGVKAINLSITVAKKTENPAETKLMRIPRLLANFSEMLCPRLGESRSITMALCQEKTRPWKFIRSQMHSEFEWNVYKKKVG